MNVCRNPSASCPNAPGSSSSTATTVLLHCLQNTPVGVCQQWHTSLSFPVTGRDTSALFQPTVPRAFCQRGHSLRAGRAAGHWESSSTAFEEALNYSGHQPCCLKSCISLQGSSSTAANCSYHPPLLLPLETLLLEQKNTAYIFRVQDGIFLHHHVSRSLTQELKDKRTDQAETLQLCVSRGPRDGWQGDTRGDTVTGSPRCRESTSIGSA